MSSNAVNEYAGCATQLMAVTPPREVAEAALAHQVGNEVERAYRRGDALEKRRELMTAWSGYCAAVKVDNVVPLRRASE